MTEAHNNSIEYTMIAFQTLESLKELIIDMTVKQREITIEWVGSAGTFEQSKINRLLIELEMTYCEAVRRISIISVGYEAGMGLSNGEDPVLYRPQRLMYAHLKHVSENFARASEALKEERVVWSDSSPLVFSSMDLDGLGHYDHAATRPRGIGEAL